VTAPLRDWLGRVIGTAGTEVATDAEVLDPQSPLHVALGATFAPRADRIYLNAARIGNTNSAVVLTTAGVLRGWALRDAVNDHLGQEMQFPPHWSTYHLDVKWTIVAAITGDVMLRWDTMALGNGANANGAPISGVPVTVTAPAQFITKISRVASSVAVDPGAENFTRLIRLGNDAADTLAGVAAVLGLAYTRAS
jgi:hypothetical protein